MSFDKILNFVINEHKNKNINDKVLTTILHLLGECIEETNRQNNTIHNFINWRNETSQSLVTINKYKLIEKEFEIIPTIIEPLIESVRIDIQIDRDSRDSQEDGTIQLHCINEDTMINVNK